MNKKFLAVMLLITICLLSSCGKDERTEQNSVTIVENTEPQQQMTTALEQQPITVQETIEDSKEMFGYRYVLPVEVTAEKKADGALCSLSSCDLFLFRKNVLEFSLWDEAIKQCEEDLYDALDSGIDFRPSHQSAFADAPFTNAHGVEMMRVTGELSGSAGTKPYIAYYYVTDENYLRFMICLNYENEAEAAEVIDYVAERLEKA